jgi:hypothetical protein
MWSAHREIAESVVTHRRTTVQAGHGVGKSWLAARIAAFWLSVHPLGEAFVVTTAPTDEQVKAVLWRELGMVHENGGLPGKITLDAKWHMGQPTSSSSRTAASRLTTAQPPCRASTTAARRTIGCAGCVVGRSCNRPLWRQRSSAAAGPSTQRCRAERAPCSAQGARRWNYPIAALGEPGPGSGDDPVGHRGSMCASVFMPQTATTSQRVRRWLMTRSQWPTASRATSTARHCRSRFRPVCICLRSILTRSTASSSERSSAARRASTYLVRAVPAS